MNLVHIVEGWSKGMGLIEVDAESKALSLARLNICARCTMAKESKFLKFLKGKAHHMDAIKCTKCGCPVNEKTLVKTETCPLGKW